MKFIRLRIPAFGQLRGLDTGEEDLPRLVVVQGRNESGKSTFFAALQSLLFGIYPTDRDKHPYTPWSGETAHVEGDVRLADASDFTVRRRLLSSPQGTVIRGDAEETIRNADLQVARHLKKEVYGQIFALTLAEMAALEGQDWEEVQDRLFGGMGVRDLRPAREVADELEAEAGPLWRTTRQGNQEIRDLKSRLRELSSERREAVEADARIRELHRELEEARTRRETLRTERHRVAARLDRLEKLAPLRQQLARVEVLEGELGDEGAFRDLPPDPSARLGELEEKRSDARSALDEVEAEMEELAAKVESFTDGDRLLLARAAGLRAALGTQAGLAGLREEQARLETAVQVAGAALEEETREVLDRRPDGDFPRLLADFPLNELGRRVAELDEARTRRAAAPPEPTPPAPGAAPTPAWLPLATLGAAGVVVVAGALAGAMILAAAGVALGAVGVFLLSRRLQRVRDRAAVEAHHDREVGRWRDRVRELDQAVETAESTAAEVLARLEPGPNPMAPRLDLVGRLEGLRARARELTAERRRLASVVDRVEAATGALDDFDDVLDGPDRDTPPEARGHLLEQRLEAAGERRQAARGAEEALERARGRRERLLREVEATEARLSGLRERLAAVGGGDVEEGCRAAEERHRREVHLEQMRAGIRERTPDLEARVEEIREAEAAGVDWSADAGTLAELRARDERLGEEAEELAGRIAELQTRVDHLGERTTADEVDGEMDRIREEIGHLARRRDRLWVLARIVREAERRVRERHQPAVLRTAADYLARLTRGRYTEFVQMGDDGRRFGVRGPGLAARGGSQPSHELAEPLSTGTREQIYMALRLALVDELDGGVDRLPLLLDEVMVNWDPDRRAAGFTLLRSVAESRQCFFFTCHPDMAAELEEHGARRIVLGA